MKKAIFAGLAATAVLTVAPAAAWAGGKHGGGGGSTTQMGCTLSASSLGTPLTVAGSGYTPGAQYTLNWIWPNSVGEMATAVTADSSGHISQSSYADWSGSYTVQVLYSGRQVASCSISV
jgi:hypothetical protein